MPDQDMQKFLDGYRKFRSGYYRENKALIDDLMNRGQSPSTMMIACSDSRIDPTLKFGVEPGDMFVVRNVANLVPPFSPDTQAHGTSAALEFAVRVLKVKHLIVMGHAKCGGIKALVDHDGSVKGDFVTSWMQIAAPAREKALAAHLPKTETYHLCEHEGVKLSLQNLMTFPWVKTAVEAGSLELHGWYFDLSDATLSIVDKNGTFTPA